MPRELRDISIVDNPNTRMPKMGNSILAQAMDRVGDKFDAVRSDERERCAKLAEIGGRELQEPAVGLYIAKLIRNGVVS
jgi:hypothetical protein